MSLPLRDTKPLRVLVVDDDPLVRLMLRAVLADPMFDLVEATSGQEALDLAAEHLPDVILLDVMMPVLDGFQTCKAFRSDPRFANVRIVMLTARSTQEDRRRGLEAGADMFFTKPFSPLALIDAVLGTRHGAA